jgi:hypothetical protein
MKSLVILNRIKIVLAIAMAFPTTLFSQNDTLPESGNVASVRPETTGKAHSLYTGLGAGTNLIYLGSSISDNKPFYSASVTYGYRNSAFASVSATHLNQTSPFVAFYNFALNYRHTFNSWFDVSSDIACYKTTGSLHDSLFADFGYANVTTGFDWKLIYTRLSFAGIVSEENGFYLQISNSRYFETNEFLHGKALIYFDPDMDILFGKMLTVETSAGNKKYGNAPPFSHPNKNPGKPAETYSEKYGLLDLQFSLPVTFSYGKASIEAEPAYLLPLYSNPLYSEPEGFTFYLNIIYKIF